MKNENIKTEFTQEQLSAISSFLEANCVGEVCVSRPDVFTGVGAEVLSDVEQAKFGVLLSVALKTGLLPGFTTRRGRAGGIHRVGAFTARDAAKATSKNKVQTPVEVDGNLVHANVKAKVIRKYLTEVLGGVEAEGGNVKIEDTSFTCVDSDGLNKYLSAMAGAVSVSSTETV